MNIRDAQEILGPYLQWGVVEKREFVAALEPADLSDRLVEKIAREYWRDLSEEIRKALEHAA
jgi:hypothetical protein